MYRGNQTINEMFLGAKGDDTLTKAAPSTLSNVLANEAGIGLYPNPTQPTTESETNPEIEIASTIDVPTRTVGDPIKPTTSMETTVAPTTPTADELAKAKRMKMIKTAVVVIIVLAVAYYFYKKKNG